MSSYTKTGSQRKRFRLGADRHKPSSNLEQHTAMDEENAIYLNEMVKRENRRKLRKGRKAKLAKVTLAVMPWDDEEA